MNEKQKIEIDPDIYGIGWRFEEPEESDIRQDGYQTCYVDGEGLAVHNPGSLAIQNAIAFNPTGSLRDVAWRNAATIEENKRKHDLTKWVADDYKKASAKFEMIEWRYDEPSEEERKTPGFISQFRNGNYTTNWWSADYVFQTIRWTILSKPTERKMTIKQFYAKWDLKIHGGRCFNGHVMITLDNELGTFLQVGRDFKGDVSELFNDYREVWG